MRIISELARFKVYCPNCSKKEREQKPIKFMVMEKGVLFLCPNCGNLEFDFTKEE